MRKAVVDVGSNSVLLVVEELSGGRWQTVYESTRVTSLGQGTRETGLLSEAAMTRTLAALSEAFAKTRELGVESTLAAATMAARIARNTPEFVQRAEAQGTPVTVLSGDDEARLGFESVAFDDRFADCERISIIDVGGQSTELATAERIEGGWHTLFERSFPMGTLALRGGVLRDERPEPPQVMQAVVEIDDTVGLCYLRNQCGTAIALGATATNLVSIREKMATWQPEKVHGAYLDFGEISRSAGEMMKMTEAQRATLVGIEPGREGTLPAGALILERFLNAIGAPGCMVSVRGWRYALLERGLPKDS